MKGKVRRLESYPILIKTQPTPTLSYSTLSYPSGNNLDVMKGKVRRLESKRVVGGGSSTQSAQNKRKLQDTVGEVGQGLAQEQGQGLAQEQGQGLAQEQGQGLVQGQGTVDTNGDEVKMILSHDQEPAGIQLSSSSSTSSSTSQELLRMQVLHDNLSHLYDLLQRYGL